MKSFTFFWWGRLESNQLPSGYEPPALTDELRPQDQKKTKDELLSGYIALRQHTL